MGLDEPISVQAQQFAWMLALHDVGFSAFAEFEPARQLAMASVVGLTPETLPFAIQDFRKYVRAWIEHIKRGAN